MAGKPIRSSSHRNEDKSKRKFEELIEPFFISGWTQRDYGVDGVVEITSNIDEEINDVEVESKCFLVQLKSSEKLAIKDGQISYIVPTKKISFWYSYNLPVAFCLYSVADDKFYYRWIDDELISSLDSTKPNWSVQEKVTLKISTQNELNSSCLNLIKKYVLSWKIPARRKLEPGKYFMLKNTGINFLSNFKALAQPFNFSSISEAIEQIEVETDQSIYRIAITGLSRVGKSSLINALLKKTVSPTGFYQTTGVPIQIIPGHEDTITVFFHDRDSITRPFSIDTVKEFADQAINEDNNKKVKIVSVSVRNQNLERGVSIFDIPGLDDPNEDVLNYTWQTVKKANAIIYVIDASPFENGGFIFRNEYKKHITTFSKEQDKVFIVFNKVDALSGDKLPLLKTRVALDLKKYELSESIGDRVFYLSAEKKIPGTDSVDQLSDSIWNYILTENKFGIIKLSLINQELFRNTKFLNQILRVRMIDDIKRKTLEESIAEVKGKLPNLQKIFKEHYDNKTSILRHSIAEKKNIILQNLEAALKKIPQNKQLPNSVQLKKYLSDSLNQSIEQLNNEYVLHINQVKLFIDTWIEDNLKQIREILSENPAQKKIDFTEIESFEFPQIDISSAWGMGLIGLVAGLIAAPGLALFGAFVGFFGNLFTAAESRRAKHVSKIVDTSRDRCDSVFEKIRVAYIEYFNEHCKLIGSYADKKINYYFKDIENQMSLFENPISESEIKLYDETFQKIEELQSKLTDFDAELRSYYFV